MTLWKDMTDEEKGAILLAHHNGGCIEYKVRGEGSWETSRNPGFYVQNAYRIKPAEPVYHTTSRPVWCEKTEFQYPTFKNYGRHEPNAQRGTIVQKYKDDVLVEVIWRAADV